jgi:hypothetical protein
MVCPVPCSSSCFYLEAACSSSCFYLEAAQHAESNGNAAMLLDRAISAATTEILCCEKHSYSLQGVGS